MKALLVFAALLALSAVFGASAQAMVAPQQNAALVIASSDSAISAGPAGALREADYFRAPPSPSTRDSVRPCRLQLRIFDKVSLAQSCH